MQRREPRSALWQTSRMAKVKVAVLGTGSLGQHHARIYSELAAAGDVELTGIFDAHAETARKIAEKNSTRVFNSIAEAAAASDALNIVTPTTTHFDIAKQLLAQGKHVLVEKPMTDSSEQAARTHRTRAEKKLRPASRPRRTLQSRFQFSPDRRHRTALHRVPSAFRLSRAQHRHRRRARSDDS